MKQKVLIILMLKDVNDGAGLFERDLQKVNVLFETSRVDCKGKFLEEIKDFHTDVILSDHFLPPFNSIEALKIKPQEKARHSFYFGLIISHIPHPTAHKK